MTLQTIPVKFTDYLAIAILYERFLSGMEDEFPMEWEVAQIIERLKDCLVGEEGTQVYERTANALKNPDLGRPLLRALYEQIFKDMSVKVLAIPDLIGNYHEVKEGRSLNLQELAQIYRFAKELSNEPAVIKLLDDGLNQIENSNHEVKETLQKELKDIFEHQQGNSPLIKQKDDIIEWLRKEVGESTEGP